MTAIESMKVELKKIQKAQDSCTTNWGFVRPQCRYRYQVLIQKAREFNNAIRWMEEQIYA